MSGCVQRPAARPAACKRPDTPPQASTAADAPGAAATWTHLGFMRLSENDMKHNGMALRWQTNSMQNRLRGKFTTGAQDVPSE